MNEPTRRRAGAGVAALIVVCGPVLTTHLISPPGAASPQLSVEIDAASSLGPSAVGDFLGGLGLTPSAYARGDPLIRAWDDAGMRHLRGLAGTWNIDVTRPRDGRLKYDFSAFDAEVSAALRLLKVTVGQDTLDFAIYGTPRPLSPKPRSKHSSEYAPTRWAQWRTYMRRVGRHVVNTWGITGARYELWNEPEDKKFYWKGRPGDDDQQRLARYVKLYVVTYRALTSVDPNAQLLAPVSPNANSAAFGAPWGLAEFVYSLQAFNDAHANNPVPIHNLDWHEYGWSVSEEGFGSGPRPCATRLPILPRSRRPAPRRRL